MGKRLFIGSLPFETTEDELHKMFSDLGNVVSTKLITDRDTGQSKGFGFVEMGSDAEALAAITKMNGFSLGSRQIVVNEARPMEARAPGGGGYKGGNGGGGKGKKGGFNRW